MSRLAFALVLLAGPIPAQGSASEQTVVAVDETKHDVLFLLDGGILLLRKWPLEVFRFETAPLEGCSLSYTAAILDLSKLKVQWDGDVPRLVCGKTRSAGRPAGDLTVRQGAAAGPGSGRWRLTREGPSLSLHYRPEGGSSEWVLSFPSP